MGGQRTEREQTCPCGRGRYAQCCGLFHAGDVAPTAEHLMRARYSAYALGLEEYVLGTWHASTRPRSAGLRDGPSTTWLGLSVKRHETDGDDAVIEFVARYRAGGRGQRLHEISRFVREAGRWYYVDGDVECSEPT
jgi:SEC-C motif-containing protein